MLMLIGVGMGCNGVKLSLIILKIKNAYNAVSRFVFVFYYDVRGRHYVN